jgi:large subunit ribosomal protein L18
MKPLRDKAERRKARVRRAIRLNAGGRARLSVHRSGKHIYAQIIDDVRGQTLAAASSLEKDLRGKSGANVDAAKVVGSSWPSAPPPRGSRRWCSTAGAISTTGASRRWPMRRARAA